MYENPWRYERSKLVVWWLVLTYAIFIDTRVRWSGTDELRVYFVMAIQPLEGLAIIPRLTL